MAICNIEDCDSDQKAKGLCGAHYQRKRMGKSLTLPIRQILQGENRTNNPLYGAYRAMKQRCANPNHKYYGYYGGRGIKVCDRWLGIDGFTHFLTDMGQKPEGLTIDRIDNEGDYTPANCRWASRTTQQINQRLSSVNTSGTKGVHWFKNANSWSVYIDHHGKRKHLGYFKSKEEAILARKNAELERIVKDTTGN